jgi:sugar/nucleoside kinase (ribokinase family)
MGLKTAFCGNVGEDETGKFVLDELTRRNIDVRFCISAPNEATGVTLALNWKGDRALVSVLGTISTFSPADFDITILKNARHLHVGSFFLQSALRPGLAALFAAAHDRGITTSLDAGWDDTGCWDYGIRAVLKYTDIFFPNETEAQNITKKNDSRAAAQDLASFCKIAVIKRGKNGAFCIADGRTYSVPVMGDMPVVDTTGAGDTFNAGFLYAFLHGKPTEACLEYGNAAGSISVGHAGGADAELKIDEIEKLIALHERCTKE